MKKLTSKQNEEIINLFKSKLKNVKDISKEYGVSLTKVYLILHSAPNIIFQKRRKHQLDESFFDEIDTQEKAYFLGLLYADGTNSLKKNSVRLRLQERDRDLLEKLRNIIKSEKPLSEIKKEGNRQTQYGLYLYSKHISQKLNELGCTPNKSLTLKFPEYLKNELIPHFIRGFMDGDGCIGKRELNFIAPLNFCEKLKETINLIFNASCIIRNAHRCTNGVSELKFYKRNEIKNILNWLYENATIYMERKYEKYQKILSWERALPHNTLFNEDGTRLSRKQLRDRHYQNYKLKKSNKSICATAT